MKKFKKAGLVSLLSMVSILAMSMTTAVMAKPKLKKADFYGSTDGASVVNVGAEGGKWLYLKSSGITYNFSYNVKANRSLRKIEVSRINGSGLWGRHNIIKNAAHVVLKASGKGSFTVSNRILGADRDVVIKACNDLLLQGKDTTGRHETFVAFSLHGLVQIGKGRYKKTFSRLPANAVVKVVCESEPVMIKAPPKPFSVDVHVTPQGESCPKKVEVRAIIKYNRTKNSASPIAKFRFKVDGELSELVEIRARPTGTATSGKKKKLI